jgi:hypothetical protein
MKQIILVFEVAPNEESPHENFAFISVIHKVATFSSYFLASFHPQTLLSTSN